MAGLTRVPAPRSPLDRWGGALGGLLVVVIVALAVEPWGSTSASGPASPLPFGATPAPSVIAAPTALTRTYRPEAFGPPSSRPDWAIRTARGIVALPALGIHGSAAVATGPVVDLGRGGDLDALVIEVPSGSTLQRVRLWRFGDDRRPERLDLTRLPAPWAQSAAWAVAVRSPGAPADQVAAWRPGLYRLDLLIEPDSRIRMVMLTVRPDDAGAGSSTSEQRPGRLAGEFDPGTLHRLPDAARVWTVGTILTGWARPSALGECGVAEIWLARGPDAACWPVPIGPTSALGVNLAAGERVTAIGLDQVDPLPGPIDLDALVGIGGQIGVAALETPDGGLWDGIYRLAITKAGGDEQHWYVEVGPEGRRAAELNAYVTNAQP